MEGFRAAMQQSLQGHHSACDGPEAAGALPAAMQQSLHVSALAEGGDSDGALGSARPSHERQDHHTRQDHRMRQDHHTSVRHEALERMDEEALRTLHAMLVRHSSLNPSLNPKP